MNVHMFWQDPVPVLKGVRLAMKPGGVLALTFQPRQRGATSADARANAEKTSTLLRDAGFSDLRIEIIPLAPVAAACVLDRAA